MRRLHRGGEGQYLINGTAVRRTDLVELLADVGLGGGAGSIISQGKVEEILASKPEERRALVEEAAGLGKFKRRRHRAELKLARVAQDVARVLDVEAEVRKRLRPLALQATAAAARREARGRDRRARGCDRELDLAAVDEQIARGAGAADGRRACEEAQRRQARGSPRRAPSGRGGARGRRRPPRGCDVGALPAAERRRARCAEGGERGCAARVLRAARRRRLPIGPPVDLRRAAASRGGALAGAAAARSSGCSPSARAFRRLRALSPKPATRSCSPSWRACG